MKVQQTARGCCKVSQDFSGLVSMSDILQITLDNKFLLTLCF